MRTRTTNPKSPKYKDYGARGINSDEFMYFVDFYDAMYESYLKHVELFGEDDTTLERIDVNGNYCKENCTWATWEQQAKNKRSLLRFKAISPNGIEYKGTNLKEFCENMNLQYRTIISGLHQHNKKFRNGWTFNIL